MSRNQKIPTLGSTVGSSDFSDLIRDDRAGWVRPLPYPFTRYLTVANDCDSTTFETVEAISRYLRGLGIDLSDSFFARSVGGYSISPLIEDRVNANAEELRSEAMKKFRRLSRSTLLDQIHGLTEAAVALKWAPIVIYPDGEFIGQTFDVERQIGSGYQHTNSLSFWYRWPSGCGELEISFVDSTGAHYTVTSGKLGSDRLGWEVSLKKDQPGRIEIDCAETGLRPTRFEAITVRLRAETAAAVVIADFTATNIGRPSIRRLFGALRDAGIRAQVLTAHGQPGNLTEISSYFRRPRKFGTRDAEQPSTVEFFEFLQSKARSIIKKVRIDQPDAREVLYTIFLSTLGRDRGNSPWSAFYCIDILNDYGINFIRSYFDEISKPVAIDNLVEEYQRDGRQFYIFRAYSPGGFGETPLNPNLGVQISMALEQIRNGPAFSGGALYTHWGNSVDPAAPHVFNDAAQAAFQKMKSLTEGREATLFVRPVSIMLRYATFVRGLKETSVYDPEAHVLRCRSWTDPVTCESFDASHEFVNGLSFRVYDAKITRVYWDDVELSGVPCTDSQADVIQILREQKKI